MPTEAEAHPTVREPSSDCAANIEQYSTQLKTIFSDIDLNRPVDNNKLFTIAEQAAIWGRNGD
jgi:hypothetical protein